MIVFAHSAGAYTATLYVMETTGGRALHPPPPPPLAWTKFFILTECTPESGGCYSVFTLWAGTVSIHVAYKCLVPIYVFPEIKLLFPKQNYNVLPSTFYTHISVRDLYISRIGLPILLQ